MERCFALYQEKRFDEVLALGEEALAAVRRDATAGPSRETAALWSVVGLAKQALGDDDGAHAALESSIDSAFETERSTYGATSPPSRSRPPSRASHGRPATTPASGWR